jgi:hypothetical protein
VGKQHLTEKVGNNYCQIIDGNFRKLSSAIQHYAIMLFHCIVGFWENIQWASVGQWGECPTMGLCGAVGRMSYNGPLWGSGENVLQWASVGQWGECPKLPDTYDIKS